VPIVARDQFHALASQEGVTLSPGESAVVLRVSRPPVNLVLTVPDNVFEWFVSVSNSETGGTVEDWVDHYGAPRAQLQAEMASEVLSFMYIGVITILLGWCLLWGSRTLVIYTVLFLCGFHLRVLLFEEPGAARQFGAQWQAYRARVPRWVVRHWRLDF
jgi:hypothetical protein